MNLMRISDSFFPIGSFTTSQGVEQFVADQLVKSDDLKSLLRAYLNKVWTSSEVPIFREAYDAALLDDINRVIDIDMICYASKLTEESRNASVKIGNNLSCMLDDSELAKNFRRAVLEKSTPGTYPVALALISRDLGIGPDGEASLLYVNLMEVAAAMVRMGEVDFLEAQNAVKTVLENIPDAPSFSDTYQSFPLADIESMRHENNECRMFMS